MKKIFIDSGHGGNDPGAVGNGMRESDINLEVALRLGEILSDSFEIRQSRTSDRALTIAERWQAANSWGADIFISIHVNGFHLDSANGTEVFIFDNGSGRSQQSRRLASELLDGFARRLGIRNRGVRLDGQSQHTGGFGVLRNTKMPAVLYELAFISASTAFPDVEALRNRRDYMAAVLAEGVRRYFGMEIAPKETETPDKTSVQNEDLRLLEVITHWEARGEDEKGQILVVNVIKNRLASRGFPDTLHGVIFQPGAFVPTQRPDFNTASPDARTVAAVERALNGEDFSRGATFFHSITGIQKAKREGREVWHERAVREGRLTRLFDHGNHRFYREV